MDAAQAELDAVDVRREASVINVLRLGDYFEPDGFHELSVPDQRRLLGLGIERVVVSRASHRGERPDGRVRIAWPES